MTSWRGVHYGARSKDSIVFFATPRLLQSLFTSLKGDGVYGVVSWSEMVQCDVALYDVEKYCKLVVEDRFQFDRPGVSYRTFYWLFS